MQEVTLKLNLILVLLLTIYASLSAQTDDEAINLHIYPYLQYATPTSIIIRWETIKPAKGMVAYSEDDSFGNIEDETAPVKMHEIKLTNLKPGTTYRYKVSYDNTTLEAASFTTAPKPGTKNWRMVAYGDNRTYPETHKRIVAQILKLNPSMIIHSGDLVASGDHYEQWKEQYFDPMRGLSENITVFPSLGNHEKNSHFYYDYMSLPDENGESYYSFDYGNAHFIALNSNAREAPFDIDSEQTQWLIRDLKENKDAEWKIVFFHHPLFRCHPSRGIEPQRWVWQEVFEEYGVDLVINGHDHYYQRTYAIGNYQGKPSRGVYHLISGGGGAPNYPVVPKVHAANRRSVHHITVMDFQDDRIVGRAIDDKGNIFDAFVYDKEAKNSPEEFISYEIFEIERDLTDAIIQMPVVDSEENFKIVDHILGVNNPFSYPLKLTLSWERSNNWTTNEPETTIIEPGQLIRLPVKATMAKKASLFPLPSARLQFQTPEGKMAFKNNTITFSPVKIWEKQVVFARAMKKLPQIDGDLSDVKWKSKFILDKFYDVQGDKLPLQKTEILVGKNLIKKVLFIAGKVEASPLLSTSGTTTRDHRYVQRGDYLQVHIGVGQEIYSYIINPKGTLFDIRNNDASWNSTAKTAATAHSEGWQFEMAIPLDELDIHGQPTTINFVRKDGENNAEYEYALTFGKSELDHRIPMYKSDRRAVERFTELKF